MGHPSKRYQKKHDDPKCHEPAWRAWRRDPETPARLRESLLAVLKHMGMAFNNLKWRVCQIVGTSLPRPWQWLMHPSTSKSRQETIWSSSIKYEPRPKSSVDGWYENIDYRFVLGGLSLYSVLFKTLNNMNMKHVCLHGFRPINCWELVLNSMKTKQGHLPLWKTWRQKTQHFPAQKL